MPRRRRSAGSSTRPRRSSSRRSRKRATCAATRPAPASPLTPAGHCRQLIIEDALDPAEIARYTDAIDRLAATEIAAGNSPDFGGTEAVYVNCQRGVIRDPAFLDLLDHPSTFPILWDLMGWNIREQSLCFLGSSAG